MALLVFHKYVPVLAKYAGHAGQVRQISADVRQRGLKNVRQGSKHGKCPARETKIAGHFNMLKICYVFGHWAKAVLRPRCICPKLRKMSSRESKCPAEHWVPADFVRQTWNNFREDWCPSHINNEINLHHCFLAPRGYLCSTSLNTHSLMCTHLKGFRYQYSLQLESYITLRVDSLWPIVLDLT